MATRLETRMAFKARAEKRQQAVIDRQSNTKEAVAKEETKMPTIERTSYFVAKRDFSAVVHGQFLSFFSGQRLVDKSLVSILQAQKSEDIEEMVDDDETAVVHCPHCGSAFMIDRG